MPHDIASKRPGLKPGFDSTAELWDRIADDLAENSSPCYQTVEDLVTEACNLPEDKDRDAGS